MTPRDWLKVRGTERAHRIWGNSEWKQGMEARPKKLPELYWPLQMVGELPNKQGTGVAHRPDVVL